MSPLVVLQSYPATCLLLTAYGYNSSVTVSLSALHCQTVGGMGSFLADYPTVSCESTAYLRLLPLIIGLLIVLVILPPVLLGVMLWTSVLAFLNEWQEIPVRATAQQRR